MAEQGDTLCGAPEERCPGVTLSDGLMVTRIRPTGLLPTSAIRLDRENISSIGKLRRLAEIHSLYLQQNQIEKIENLDSFPNLRFLCLAGNRIQRVQNLQALPHLSALDLSHNQIRVLDTEELPRSLQILDLTGNKCTRQDGYRDLVVAALPRLLQLDSQPIHGNTAEEEAGGGSSSSEEEEKELLPELRTPFTVDRDFFVDLHWELAGRARRRRRKTLEEHRERLQELSERRALLLGSAAGPGTGAAAGAVGAPGAAAGAVGAPGAAAGAVGAPGAAAGAVRAPGAAAGAPGAAAGAVGAPGSAAGPGAGWSHRHPQVKPGTRLSPLPVSRGSQRAPGGIQLPANALEKETCAKGAGNGQLSQISPSSSVVPRSWE